MSQNIKISYPAGYSFTHKQWAGGEEHVRIIAPEVIPIEESAFTIDAAILNSQDLVVLLMVNNAIKQMFPNANVTAVIKYLPYARQDRVCNKGEAFSLQVLAALLDTAKFCRVQVWDCHSSVGIASITNISHIPAVSIVSSFAVRDENFAATLTESTFVAPDDGSLNKVRGIAFKFQAPMIYCNKVRYSEDVRVDVIGESPEDSRFLIIDDICDGGRTFIATAEAIRRECPAATFKLYVTHGIFSYGLTPLFEAGITEVFVANDIRSGGEWVTHRAP